MFRNSGSCVAQAFFTLEVTSLPSVTISASSTTICPNTTATLTAISSSNLYNWSNGSTTSVITVTPSASTTYSVAVFNSCGSTTGTININTSNIVTVSAITSNTLLCTGQSAVLTANGASSYTWMPMGTISQTVIVAPSSPTTYTLLGASSCGNASNTITQNVSLCTDLASMKDNSEITIYPNPNYGIINVDYPASLIGSTNIEVYDALSKLVISEVLINNTTTISTQHLEAGVYFYHVINNNNRVKIGKIIKQ